MLASIVFGMLFLYFPEDKREYIPAAISFGFFLLACILLFVWIVKHSKREEEKLKKFEEEIKRKGFSDQSPSRQK